MAHCAFHVGFLQAGGQTFWCAAVALGQGVGTVSLDEGLWVKHVTVPLQCQGISDGAWGFPSSAF